MCCIVSFGPLLIIVVVEVLEYLPILCCIQSKGWRGGPSASKNWMDSGLCSRSIPNTCILFLIHNNISRLYYYWCFKLQYKLVSFMQTDTSLLIKVIAITIYMLPVKYPVMFSGPYINMINIWFMQENGVSTNKISVHIVH